MKKEKKSGLPAILGSLIGPIIGAISERRRNGETPKKAGRVRDLGGLVIGAGIGANMAEAAGVINLESLNLTEEQFIICQGVAYLVGIIMYFTGIGKTTNEPPKEPKP